MSDGKKMELFWNVPDNWPDIIVEHLIPEQDRADYVANVAILNSALIPAFEAHPSLNLQEISHSRMLESGVLEVPFEVDDGSDRYALFLFTDSSRQSASIFKGIEKLYADGLEGTPIYIAPSPLPSENIAPGDPLRTFAFDLLLKLAGDAAPKGDYAMWWPFEGEHFSNSPTHERLTRIFTALNGIESYVTAMLLRNLDMVDEQEQAFRTELPPQQSNIPILGPDGVPILICLSREKGIRFLFHVESTTPLYRDMFLGHLAEFVEQIRNDIAHHGIPLDEDSQSLGWFKSSVGTIQLQEGAGGELETFGTVRV